jgi:hypothetical protein
MGRRLVTVVAVALLGAALIGGALIQRGRAEAGLPDSVLQDIAALSKALRRSAQASSLIETTYAVVRPSDKAIADRLAAYAEGSRANADRLAAYCQQHIRGYYAAGPSAGASVEAETLAVWAYLLARTAPLTSEGASPRDAVVTLRDAYLAQKRTEEAWLRQHMPGRASILSDAPEGAERMIDNRAIGLVWACDQLMVALYLADDPVQPPAAAAVVNQYWAWRDASMREFVIEVAPALQHMPKIPGFVEQLAQALSEG